VHHVHQSMRRRPFLQSTIVAPVQRLANTLNDPRARFQTAGSARREWPKVVKICDYTMSLTRAVLDTLEWRCKQLTKHFLTARCTLVQSAVLPLRSHVVCPSVC